MPSPFVLVPTGTLAGRGAGARVELPADARHHLSRVLRLREGAAVVVADGAGVVAAGRVAGDGVVALTEEPAAVPPPTPRVRVLQALGKGRKHDDVVRVLTELGVDAVTAVTTERTVVDLDGKADRVRGRWEAVARSACAQARRAHLPEVDGPTPVADLLDRLGRRPCLLAHVGETTDPLAAAEAAHGTEEVVVAIGPEGGWTDHEVATFTAAGAIPVGLGPTVLRTEHAATVLASIVLAAAGRMRP
jgi:16S rRNA (uracil1498-N3)-methyltransferase